MSRNHTQLSLLADHIKLSLLERQRAKALQLDSRTQDAEISRSLESLRNGVSALNGQEEYLALQQQYDEMYKQFHGSAAISNSSVLPNNPALADDFSKVQTARLSDAVTASSALKKSVRFTDTQDDDGHRIALLPYRDNPEDVPDHSHLDNQQIHEYHSDIMRRQDEELDILGASIGRQRELSIRIGGELDEQVQIIDDVDSTVDRHQTQMDRAKSRLNGVVRRAKDNIGMTVIAILILLLILLLIVL